MPVVFAMTVIPDLCLTSATLTGDEPPGADGFLNLNTEPRAFRPQPDAGRSTTRDSPEVGLTIRSFAPVIRGWGWVSSRALAMKTVICLAPCDIITSFFPGSGRSCARAGTAHRSASAPTATPRDVLIVLLLASGPPGQAAAERRVYKGRAGLSKCRPSAR